jgi:hypothetical protein
VEHGDRYTINREPSFRDVKEYLSLQGRFGHLTEEQIAAIRRNVGSEWKRLRAKVRLGDELQLEDGCLEGMLVAD